MHRPDSTKAPRATRRAAAVALAGAVALGYVVRAAPTSRIFTPEGVRLAADGDTYYHALRAERIAAAWPTVPWRDPGMNYPYGADIPWPPLLDQIVASAAVATGSPTPDHVARVAALVPPVLGACVVLLAAAAEAILAAGPGWQTALLVALLPAAVRQSFVGRADHHVLEVFFFLAAFLAFAAGSRARARPARFAPILASALVLSFWNWSGSALYLVVLSACAAALHLVSPPHDPAPKRSAGLLAWSAGIAAAILAASIAAWGPAGALASLRLTPITGLAVVLLALTAAGAAGIALARRLDPGAGPIRRAAHLAAAAAVPAVILLALPSGEHGGLSHGLAALGASSPWYSTITEFWPLFLSGRQPFTMELRLGLLSFGLAPLLLVPAAVMLRQRYSRDAGRRPELLFLAVWTVGLCGLALLRRRFEGYAVVPLAVTSCFALRETAAKLRPRFIARAPWMRESALAIALVAVLAPGLPLVLRGDVVELPDGAEERFPILDWLRGVTPLAGREGVLSTWSNGHEIQWLARKPVVSTPFGTDIDPRSIADEATFFTTLDPAAARALLERRRIGFLLLENPVREVATLAPYATGSPRWVVEERGVATGSRYALDQEFFDLVASRLFFYDGGLRDGTPRGLSDYRLLAESLTPVDVLGSTGRRYKLFGVVRGAGLEVRGAPPRSPVSVSTRIRTNVGRSFIWSAEAEADERGVATLELPYATGANGLSFASPYEVGGGAHAVTVRIGEEQVVDGRAVRVDVGR